MTLETQKTPPNLRMLEMLKQLAAAGHDLSVQDMVTRLGWPKQSVHRLAQSLVDAGYLERNGRHYAPSRQLANLANGLLQFAPRHQSRHQILMQLSADSRETVNFVMPMDDGMKYVDRVDTNWPFRILLPVGTSVPFHCTASGKTYLAHMRSDQRRRMLETLNLEAHTPKTHTDPDRLNDELQHIRRQGYALDDEEFFDNMFAIAVPIFDFHGRYYAALATHGPKQRFDRAQALKLIDKLKDYSAQITQLTFNNDNRDHEDL